MERHIPPTIIDIGIGIIESVTQHFTYTSRHLLEVVRTCFLFSFSGPATTPPTGGACKCPDSIRFQINFIDFELFRNFMTRDRVSFPFLQSQRATNYDDSI